LVTVLELEKAAARLRRELKAAVAPEIRLLCGLRFGDVLREAAAEHREAYLREFLAALAEVASRCDRAELLPEELKSLRQFVGLCETEEGLRGSGEVGALSALSTSNARSAARNHLAASDGRAVRVNGLFVEYYPDLDLPPRGRLLTLRVTAMALPGSADDDDVVVRNPVSDPDDRFLAQARDSVAAARLHLSKRYGWTGKKKYRFDFTVESVGARFTGDSLGVAFAVGAIAALGRIEALSDEMSVSPVVAFCGAMASHGVLAPVDVDALRVKVYRGFWSGLKVLVIPRVHFTEAWAYLKELEAANPGRKLELMGADSLDDVAGDPRLVPVRRLSVPDYTLRRIWASRRSAWFQVSIMVPLLYALLCLVYPPAWILFDRAPAEVRLTPDGFEVLNADHRQIWRYTCSYPLDTVNSRACLGDLAGDETPEVAFMPFTSSDEISEMNSVFVFRPKEGLVFQLHCFIWGEYPGDSIEARFTPSSLHIVDTGGGTVLVSAMTRSLPARTHIGIWSSTGQRVGWYVASGQCSQQLSTDWNGDGTPELFFTGVNNRLVPQSAYLLSLPLVGLNGASPPYAAKDWDLTKIKRGNQFACIYFPPTDALPTTDAYNDVLGLSVENRVFLKLLTGETGPPPCGLFYFLDRQLRVKSVTSDDSFRLFRDSVAKDRGEPPVSDWGTYFQTRQTAVAYWVDSGWVTDRQHETGP